MRILTAGSMYPPHHLGGYELVWRSAVQHLRAAGHEVEVLCTTLRLPGVTAPDDPAVHRELLWYWRDHAWPRRSLRRRVAIERHNAAVLRRRLDALRPDVVAWWHLGGLSLSLLPRARARGLPSVALVQDDWMLYAGAEDQWHRLVAGRPWLRPLARALTGHDGRVDGADVDLWLFVSDWTRRRALDAGWRLPRAEVAHSGFDAAFVDPRPERPWRWRLLSVGRIDERKGIDVAVDALARLPAEATLTVVGDGDARALEALRGQVARLGLGDRVRFTGPVARAALPALFEDHDAVVFSVRWDEPWGLVPLEAMALGRPVVATAGGGSREYLRDGENALVVARDDPAGLADAVARLAADPALRATLRAGGSATAPRHTDAVFNRRLAEALDQVARRGPPTSTRP